MKAIVFERFGGPEVLELREVPAPVIRPDEVRIEVKAVGINHLDLWVRAGLPGLDPEMPHILGGDIVGVAAEVGSVIRHVMTGDKVLVLPTLSCGACAQNSTRRRRNPGRHATSSSEKTPSASRATTTCAAPKT